MVEMAEMAEMVEMAKSIALTLRKYVGVKGQKLVRIFLYIYDILRLLN